MKYIKSSQVTEARKALLEIIKETKEAEDCRSFVNCCEKVACSVCPIAQEIEGTEENCNSMYSSEEWENIYIAWLKWIYTE